MIATGASPSGGSKRIVFVIDAVHPFSRGGRERRLWEITRRLARKGHDVHVYTMKWWPGPETIELDGVSLHALCRLYPLYGATRRSPRQALLFGFATARLLTKRFDALDVDQMPYFPLFSASVVCALRGRRLTATWHEVWGPAYWASYLGSAAPLAYLIERLSAHMPHQIISVSQQTSDRLRNELAVTVPISTVPLGVDIEGIDAAPFSGATTDILYAGRLIAHKNVDMLIRAVSIVCLGRPGLRCTIVGEGPERPALEQLVRDLELSDIVTFVGFLPDAELYGVMKSSGVFVLPSIREGFGLVVVEAGMCGLPAITVRHPDNAARHLILEGRNGFLADPDSADLARAIECALSRRASLDPSAALKDAGFALSWDAVANRVERVLLGQVSEIEGLSLDEPKRSAAIPAAQSSGANASRDIERKINRLASGSMTLARESLRFIDFKRARATMAISNWQIAPTVAEKRSHNVTHKVLLTFDDYTDSIRLSSILQILKRDNVKAIFFIRGDYASKNPSILRAIADEEHWIGNHSRNHRNLMPLSNDAVRCEIKTGIPSKLFRPPFGAYDSRIRQIAAQLGCRICYWDIDSDDWKGISEDEIRRRVVRGLHPGACVLLHLNGEHTVEALPGLLADIRSRGYALCNRNSDLSE